MDNTRRTHLKLLGAAALVGLSPRLALADTATDTASTATQTEAETAPVTQPVTPPVTHEIQMYSKDPEDPKKRNVFKPDIVRANPGDTIRFVAAQKGHNSALDKNMAPDGVELWKSKISKDFEITVTQDGTYGYFCTPHRTLGMVGLILVGDPSANYEAAKAAKQRGKAKKLYKDIFERADALLAAEA